MERKLWELLCANVLILALIILAAIVSGWGEALAWLGGLLATDVRIVSRWGKRGGGRALERRWRRSPRRREKASRWAFSLIGGGQATRARFAQCEAGGGEGYAGPRKHDRG